jgi:hypothetical protein
MSRASLVDNHRARNLAHDSACDEEVEAMLSALEYALGIYLLSTIVTIAVWLLVVMIRWLSSERPQPNSAGGKL